MWVHKSCRPCENAILYPVSRTFFHTGAGTHIGPVIAFLISSLLWKLISLQRGEREFPHGLHDLRTHLLALDIGRAGASAAQVKWVRQRTASRERKARPLLAGPGRNNNFRQVVSGGIALAPPEPWLSETHANFLGREPGAPSTRLFLFMDHTGTKAKMFPFATWRELSFCALLGRFEDAFSFLDHSGRSGPVSEPGSSCPDNER